MDCRPAPLTDCSLAPADASAQQPRRRYRLWPRALSHYFRHRSRRL
jgi:hypothetical protein